MSAYRLVKMVRGYPLTSAGPYRVYSSRAEVLQALGPHEACHGDYAGTFNPRHPAATDYYVIARSARDPQLAAVTDTPENIAARLEYLRGEIQGQRISYSELSELQGLAAHIDAGDTELLEWAGVPENTMEGAPVIKGGAPVSTAPGVPKSFPREYKGWIINARNTWGMYTATNYSDGYPQVTADTLQGIKHAVTAAIAEGLKS